MTDFDDLDDDEPMTSLSTLVDQDSNELRSVVKKHEVKYAHSFISLSSLKTQHATRISD